MSDIIICHEKHGEFYWDAQTPEAWAASSLAILTERWNEGFWYSDPDDDGLGESEWAEKRREEYRQATALSTEALMALPEKARKEVVALRARAKRESEEDERYHQWYQRAKEVVENQDVGFIERGTGRARFTRKEPRAWVLLVERSDHEYERVELETLQTAQTSSQATA